MPFHQWLSAVIAPVCFAAGAFLLSRRCLHFFQLESYQARGYLRTLKRQAKTVFSRFLLSALYVLTVSLIIKAVTWLGTVMAALMIPAGLWFFRADGQKKEKKPLKFTARVKRLCVGYVIALAGLDVTLSYLVGGCMICAAVTALTPAVLIAASWLVWPVERLIYEYYFQSAKGMLMKQKGLIRIGITGSYGKTSNKFILDTLLRERFSVLTTPGSFNTPMGLSRVIRERLQPGHQVFIGEMGARHRGDIRELCRLVKPQIGMLTAVGAQHLDTFKTVDRIAETKYDLIRALPEDGLAVFLDDGDRVKELFGRTRGVPAILTGRTGDDAWPENISCDSSGSHFDIHFKGEEETLHCSTMLLGRMNIDNITACAALARRLGVTPRQLQRGIGRLRPVEHRMQLIPNPGGVTVIDDSFNSNPVSSAMALETLALFPGRRIIVTPGMVELGKDEKDYNRAFGEKMASCVDEAVLVGEKHTGPIREGLISRGFPAGHIHVFKSLEEAVGYLNSIRTGGDVILYENDLPDNYS